MIFFVFFGIGFAQQTITGQNQSTHQLQSEYYSKFKLTTEGQWDSLNNFIKPLRTEINLSGRQSACSLNKRVFGFFPYWTGSTYTGFDWSLVSDICYFDYIIDSISGKNRNASFKWLESAGVTEAQSRGVKAHFTITLFSKHAVFFSNANNQQQTLIDSVISLLKKRNGKGVNVDFEAMYSSTLKQGFTDFMIKLSDQVHAAIPGSEISVDVQKASNSAIDFVALNPYVDLWIQMGYDYYTGSKTAGPTDPLYPFQTGGLNMASVVNEYLTKYNIPLNKFILALPYYGNGWGVNNPCALPTPYNSSIYHKTISQILGNTGYYSLSNRKWDDRSFSYYYCFEATSPAGPNEFFIDGVEGMAKRFDLINQRKIAGLGIWALGYDNNTLDYWNLISQKFSDCSVIACSDNLYDMGGPFSNYNNNEDYSFTVSSTNATPLTLSFSSFDLELNNDFLKIYDGATTSSALLITLTGNSLPSPVVAPSGLMTLEFHSDGATTGSGFSAIYSSALDLNCNPDLIISNPLSSSSSVMAGSSITVSCSESNSGNTMAGVNTVSLYLSSDNILTPGSKGDVYLDRILFHSVPAKSSSLVYSKNILIPDTTASGNYYLFFWADGAQAVNESRENNNFASVQISVVPPPPAFSGIKVYPNPASGLINIDGFDIDNGDYEIYLHSAIGQLIFTDKVNVIGNAMQIQFSAAELTNGIYFMTIKSGKGISVMKILVSR